MIYAEAALLSLLVVLGVICAITDIRKGIIPNRFLFIGFCCGIPLHIILLFLGATPYYTTWLINMVLADIFAFVLYMNKLWAAGDAKLFMIIYFLLPPPLLDAGSLTYCVVPYIFIFIPALFWVLMDSVIKLIRGEPRKSKPVQLKNVVSNIVRVMIETTGVFCLVSFFADRFIADNELFFSLLLMIYAYFCSSNFYMKKWYIVLLHIPPIVIACILGRWVLSFPRWQNYILMAVILGMQQFVSMYNYQQITPNEVKKGMIPSAENILLFNKSRIQSLPTDASEELTAKITEEEAEAIHRWGKSANGLPHIWIVRKIPFAIMITFGFIAWTILRIVR